MFRIILIIVIFGAAYLIVKAVKVFLVRNKCEDCNGHGYWLGTRGERNDCRTCRGTGKKQR